MCYEISTSTIPNGYTKWILAFADSDDALVAFDILAEYANSYDGHPIYTVWLKPIYGFDYSNGATVEFGTMRPYPHSLVHEMLGPDLGPHS